MSFQIAIDGPVAAGKGTVSKLVAKRLGFVYIDTGAMYRVAALIALKKEVNWENAAVVADLVDRAEIILKNPSGNEIDSRQTTVIVDSVDVSWAIRTEEIGRGASEVAKLPEVRKVLVKKQQLIAATTDVVMEGRDITFRVLPQADLKIYLTASDSVRAARRHQELLVRGEDVSLDKVLSDLHTRDQQDMERDTDPLHIVDDAWVLDTSTLTIEQVVDQIEHRVKSIIINRRGEA